MGYEDQVDFSTLIGVTLTHIDVTEDKIIFTASDGQMWKLFHMQDCCESVIIDDICGDLVDLLNTPIILAEECSNEAPNAAKEEDKYINSFTWTFYRLQTIKGVVTIKWYGVSNGYYSESVEFEKII